MEKTVERLTMDKYIYSHSKQYFAFNIWSMETAKCIIDAAAQTHQDVILQTSVKAFESMEKEELRAFVTSYSQKKNVHAYLHLDHCRHKDIIQEAVEWGWDSVMIDASDKPLEENIRMTNEVCSIVRGKGILVEAEIGRIGGTEEISCSEAEVAQLGDVDSFLQYTAVDMLAVAVGTSHGLYRDIPKLRYDLIEKVGMISDIPLVIHGGTGLGDEVLVKLLACPNIKKINISTDVKQAYRRGIEEGIRSGYLEEKGFNPLKVEQAIHDSITSMAAYRLAMLECG